MGSRGNDSDYDTNNSHADTETTFLKRKIIEIHEKLLRELELTKQLEEKVGALDARNEHLRVENESLKRKADNKSHEDTRAIERKLREAENKADLMRNDLDAMRTKIIAQMLEKTKLEELVQSRNDSMAELEATYRRLTGEIKKKDAELLSLREEEEERRARFQEIFFDLTKHKNINEQLKRKEVSLTSRIGDLENLLKAEKERSVGTVNERRAIEKELSLLKSRSEDNGTVVTELNSRIQQEGKEKDKLKLTIEKLTNELNQMTLRYKVKEKELEEEKDRPTFDEDKKRRNFIESKELVHKLESQQKEKEKRSHRKMRTDFSPSPLKHNESPKKDYMENISEMGKLQNILLQSNITKNKLMTEIDKIEGVKVKTNELYVRRKQFQEELADVEELITHTKAKLRTLNAM